MIGYTIGYFLGTLLFPFLMMSIIGGIYYLLTRPRTTFWHAVFSWWNILIGVAIFVLSIIGKFANSR
jgi:hypothetical protein